LKSAEDMMTVLDAVDDGGELAAHSAGTEDLGDLVGGQSPQTELAQLFQPVAHGMGPRFSLAVPPQPGRSVDPRPDFDAMCKFRRPAWRTALSAAGMSGNVHCKIVGAWHLAIVAVTMHTVADMINAVPGTKDILRSVECQSEHACFDGKVFT
jgi:hypothetical protein